MLEILNHARDFYMIYLIANSKGGVGKTTIATSISAELNRQNRSVIGVDLDSNESSVFWSENREHDNGKFYRLTGNIEQEVLKVKNEYDDIVIDAGGYDSTESRSALMIADVLIAPLKMGSQDVNGLYRMLDVVAEVNKVREKPISVKAVITMAPSLDNSKELKDLIATLNSIGDELTLCNTIIRNRIAYVRAYRDNLGITELENNHQNKPAINEFINFFQEVSK